MICKDDIILNKYKIENELGKGKFGVVFKGMKIRTKEEVAIKTEPIQSEFKILKHETMIINHLFQQGCRCIPFIYWYGTFKQTTCLVMTYYNQSLFDIKDKTKIMVKLIDIMENIHSQYVIHRDIKPQNFMIDEEDNIFIIDFGLAGIYVDDDKKHVKPKGMREYIMGTPKYISYNIHHGYEASRRDDLISLGYVYIYLLRGTLEWENIHTNVIANSSHHHYKSELYIMHPNNQYRMSLKKWESISNICSSINENIYRYMEYCYRLGFETTPNYQGLRNLFRQ
jgi:serine/threonine protein kinase